jgi:predicted lysophospholipase L1 biosynthesis ABC-type transport system permease subunit
MRILAPPEEADRLLSWHGGALAPCLADLNLQFQVLQTRSQLLLTLATLTLTITGFSGPKIAQTNALARYSIGLGLVFVLISTILVLISTLRIQWMTQVEAESPRATLIAILTYRNQKSVLYRVELLLLVIGLTCYVTSVVTYLICLPPGG